MFRRLKKLVPSRQGFNVRSFSTTPSIEGQQPISGTEYAKMHPAPKRPINILYFGSTEFAVPTLKALYDQKTQLTESGFPLVGELEVVVPPVKMKRIGKKFGEVSEQCKDHE